MKKREADFITNKFKPWLKANPMYSFVWEAKQTTEDSIPFSAVEEHQIDFLLAAKSKTGLNYKFSDESRGTKPFDGIYCREMPAYLIIKFPKMFCLIDVETFVAESKKSKRRSLTSSRAADIAVKVVQNKA